MVCWTIESLVRCGIKDIIVVSGPHSKAEEEIGDGKKFGCRISCVNQEEPRGTGNAILQAKTLIKRPFLLLHPYRLDISDFLGQILKQAKDLKSKLVFISAPTDKPRDYGILRLSREKVIEVCENPLPGAEPSKIRTLGIYYLDPLFFEYYSKVDQHKEENLIDAFNLLMRKNTASAVVLKEEGLTLKYPWHTFGFMNFIFAGRNFKPHIAKSAIIGKNVVIKEKVFIGEETIIGDNTVINGPCFIGNRCKIGASNVLRGPVNLEEGVVTGAFAEIKNCIIGKDTHVHSGYFGDSIIGENCRFGAGFVVANRRIDRQNVSAIVKGQKIDTGSSYFGFVMGNNTRVGINVSTMPGVLIGSNCVIGPNTMVKENIEDDTLFYTTFQGVKKKRNQPSSQ